MRPVPILPAVAALLLAGAAAAQEAPATPIAPTAGTEATARMDMSGLLTADSVEGAEIYSFTQAQDASFWDSGEQFSVVTTDWDSIGRVQDVIIDRNGAVVGVTTDVGGFLGMGRRAVLLMLDDIRLVATDDNEIMVITRLTQERLEALDELTGVLGYD